MQPEWPLMDKKIKIVKIETGIVHVAALSVDGDWWVWGLNLHGSLVALTGKETEDKVASKIFKPVRIPRKLNGPSILSRNIINLKLGFHKSAVIVSILYLQVPSLALFFCFLFDFKKK